MRGSIFCNFISVENNVTIPEKKSSGPIKRIFKFFAWLLLIAVFLVGSAIALVFVYEDEVKQAIIGELNKNLKSEVRVDPKNIDITFVKSFPKCALEFKDVLILEALEKKERDTLIYANDILLMFSLQDIWNKNYTINKIKLNKANFYPAIDKKGNPNYIFWKSTEAKGNEKVSFKLEEISLSDIRLRFKNAKNRFKTSLHFHNSEFTGNFSDKEFALVAKGKADVNYITGNKTNYLRNKKIRYDLELNVTGSNYNINKAELALNEMYFALEGNCKYSDSLEKADLTFSGKNLDIASVLSLLPDEYSNRIKDYESDGRFYGDGKINYKSGFATSITADFGIKNATVTYKPNNTQLKELIIEGKLVSNENDSYLNFANISANMGKNSISGFCLLSNLSDPYLNMNAEVNTDLAELNSFWPIDTLEYISGSIHLNASVKGKLSEIKKSAFSNDVIAQGKADLMEIKTKFKDKPNEINISTGHFEMANRSVKLNDFKIIIGKSDVELNGELPGFINYLTDQNAPLVIDASLKSGNLILEDVMYGGESKGESQQINIPSNLNFKLAAVIEKLSFSKFEATNLKGDVVIANQKILLSDLSLNTMDGHAVLNASADASGENIHIKAASDLSKINISKLFYQCNNFGQNTLNEKHLNGFATATLNFSGDWSKTLNADLNSVAASGNLSVEQGRLVDFKPLLSLSKYIEVNELRDIKFQALQSHFDIANQVISIPKTTIKNSAMNIDLWGKHTFKNEIDYHIQLLLSELLANKKRANKQLDEEMEVMENDPENRRSVFIVMTGTVDNPIIKYDRKGLKQKIGEDIKAEKQTLKQILKEEFGLFKKDSTLLKNEKPKAEEKFKIDYGDNKENKPKPLQPKKKEEDDDDF